MFKENLIYHVIKYLRYEHQIYQILSDSVLLQDSCDFDNYRDNKNQITSRAAEQKAQSVRVEIS